MDKKVFNYITSLHQNIDTAVQSIEDILPRVENKGLEKLLHKHLEGYKKLNDQVTNLTKKLKLEVKDNNWFEKARLWTSIKMTTMMDNSTRHITEMLLLGTQMGIINNYKDAYDHKNVSPAVDKLLQKLDEYQNKCYEQLKPYLLKK